MLGTGEFAYATGLHWQQGPSVGTIGVVTLYLRGIHSLSASSLVGTGA